MSNLQKWEEKIKEKRKKTEFREFVKEIASWFNVMFYKNKYSLPIPEVHWLDRIKMGFRFN